MIIMIFEEIEFDFGIVNEGEKVFYIYIFINIGDELLIFSNVKGSCGCIVLSWLCELIVLGVIGEIIVEFNFKNKKGKCN